MKEYASQWRMLGLFAGFCGFEKAHSLVLGPEFNPVALVEINPYSRHIIRKQFPKVPLYGDIRKVNGRQWLGKLDIVTGGFPCQPFSVAGKRRGTADNRFLWPEMRRIIAESEPTWVIAENVAGILSMEQPGPVISVAGGAHCIDAVEDCQYEYYALEAYEMVLCEIWNDLEEMGYEVQPFVIPACAVDAPHRRDRVWIVAHANSRRGRPDAAGGNDANGHDSGRPKKNGLPGKSREKCGTGIMADAYRKRKSQQEGSEQKQRNGLGYSGENVPDANGIKWNRLGETRHRGTESSNFCQDVSDTSSVGSPATKEKPQLGRERPIEHRNGDGGSRRQENAAGRWTPEPELGRMVDGLPYRLERIRGLGNAIVPQVAAEIIRLIVSIELESKKQL